MIDYQQATNELTTVRDVIRWSASQFSASGLFFGHGTDNAWDEAVALVIRALHLSFASYQQVLDARVTLVEKQRLMELIKQRIEQRIPVPYLLQEAWFAGLNFEVNEQVLIPRSPIAELIEQQFEPWVEPEQVSHILDLCTGSACIAIACAVAFAQAQIDAVDIDKAALEVAKRNVIKHHLQQQVTLYQSDLFSALPAKRYDIIVSNPPYVSHEEMHELPAEYRHEPVLALEAKEEGLAIALQILREAPNYLTKHGILIVEVGNSEQALVERCPEVPFTWLDFQRGGHGIFLLTAEQLNQYQDCF